MFFRQQNGHRMKGVAASKTEAASDRQIKLDSFYHDTLYHIVLWFYVDITFLIFVFDMH